MILLHGESCNFPTTLSKMAAGGKAYASRSSNGRLSASTVVARGSGTGDTNKGNLLLTLWQTGLFEPGASCCISLGRPPERETTLLDGLAWIACLLPHSAGWNVSGLESYLISGAPDQDSPY